MTVKILAYPEHVNGIVKIDDAWMPVKRGIMLAPIAGSGSRRAAITAAGTNKRLKFENGVLTDA